MIASIDMLNELKFFYTNEELATHLAVSVSSIDKKEPTISDALSEKIYAFFQTHCLNNSEEVEVQHLSTYSIDHPLLVSTPDGFNMIMAHYIKQPRVIEHISVGEYSLRCSNDHLIETEQGWKKAETLEVSQMILTKTGYQPITARSTDTNKQVVYDFEVGHPNHRYWSHGISSHNTGKSFIAGSVIREAQQAGAFNLIIDSENALDQDYLEKIGVDYKKGVLRKRVVKLTDAWTLIRSFLDGYVAEYGDKLDKAPKVHITIDSLGFMMTDSDYDNAEKGEFRADQGAQKKLTKDLLKKLTHAVAGMNITYLCTDQVYQARAEQIMAGTAINGAVLNEQVKFAFHQIAYLSRLKLKDDKTKLVTGIRLKVAAAKTRFTQPFGQIELEVPYLTGIDPFNGLLEVAVAIGVVEKKGARYAVAGDETTWYAKDFSKYQADVLIKCESLQVSTIHVDTGLEPEEVEKPVPFANKKRIAAELLEAADK